MKIKFNGTELSIILNFHLLLFPISIFCQNSPKIMFLSTNYSCYFFLIVSVVVDVVVVSWYVGQLSCSP